MINISSIEMVVINYVLGASIKIIKHQKAQILQSIQQAVVTQQTNIGKQI